MSSLYRIRIPLTFAAMMSVGALPLSAQEIPEKEFPKPNGAVKDGLKSVRSVQPLPDGRVLVYDDDIKKIVVADLASGKLETRMSEGDAENEFHLPGPLWAWPGDSVVVADGGKSRMMFFGPDGKLARTAPLGPSRPPASPPGQPAAPSGQPAAPRGSRLPNARTLIGTDLVFGTGFPQRDTTPRAPTAPPARMPYPVLRYSLRTLRQETVVTLMPAQSPRTPTNPTQTNGGTLSIYVSTAPVQSVDVWAALSDGTVAVVRAASYRVEWFPPVGEHTFTDPVPFTPIPVTNNDKKRVVEDFKRIGEQVLANHPMRTAILAVSYEEPQTWPPTHPPFRGDIQPQVDPQDRIWLATRCAKDEQATCYDVIGRNGARVERYKLPPKTRVIGFGKGVVFTVFEQKSDKDVLQRHSLD